MPRRRLGVALLLPPPWSHEVDGLRRACGDGQLERIPAHCTLVPPVNVREDDVVAVLAGLRRAAGRAAVRLGHREGPATLALRLGPVATFHPDSPTLYLAVDDGDGLVSALRDDLVDGPLDRPTRWPFVAHVTLADDITGALAVAAVEALADYRATVVVDRVHLLEQVRDDQRGRRWVPIADAPLRVPAVVGRGGIEVELSASARVGPDVAGLVPPPPTPPGAVPLVVTARRGGEVVGAVAGWVRGSEHRVSGRRVHAEHRGLGIGRHLDAAFAAHAAEADGVGADEAG